MTLTTHAVVGAALATLLPSHPEIGFGLAFMSHFLLDAIPHWDYHLKASHENTTAPLQSTLRFDRGTIADLAKIGADGLLGLFLAFALFWPASAVVILAGALGGMLPDGLQFLFYTFHGRLLTALQRFHIFIHAEWKLSDYPAAGAIIQIGIILCIMALHS